MGISLFRDMTRVGRSRFMNKDLVAILTGVVLFLIILLVEGGVKKRSSSILEDAS